MDEVNAGRTIIEKLEDATDVGFAIVLYTGCDEGRKKALPLCAIEHGRMSFSSMVIYVQNLGVIVLSL